jgi:hypothetical protein
MNPIAPRMGCNNLHRINFLIRVGLSRHNQTYNPSPEALPSPFPRVRVPFCILTSAICIRMRVPSRKSKIQNPKSHRTNNRRTPSSTPTPAPKNTAPTAVPSLHGPIANTRPATNQTHPMPLRLQTPCPDHEEFNDSFWSMSPFSAEYAQALFSRNLPMPENLQSYAA